MRTQWLESWRQREDLKLVFNRRMRTRMYGGVGGVRSNAAPIPIRMVRVNMCDRECRRPSQCHYRIPSSSPPQIDNRTSTNRAMHPPTDRVTEPVL